MRRALTAGSLVFGAFALLTACQAEPPSKPCICPKGSGCQCPLSGSGHASGGANQGGTASAKPEEHVAQRDHQSGHSAAHAGRHTHGRQTRTARRETEQEAREEGRGERSGGALAQGALPYDYHSQSDAYSLREGHRDRDGYASEEQHAYRMRHHFHWMHRHMEERSSSSGDEERGSRYGEDYGPPERAPQDQAGRRSGGETEEEAGPAERYMGSGQMSINSPSALDSWHGYDVDCPELDREK